MGKWREVKLGDIAFTKSGGTPKRSQKSFWVNGEIPWLKSGELNDNKNITENTEYITQKAIENSSAKLFPKGSLLLAMYGATAGKLGILGMNAATNQAVCSIQNRNGLYIEEFIFNYLLLIREKIIRDSFGGAQPNISKSYIDNIKIPLPPLSEQNRIVTKLDGLFAKIDQAIRLLEENIAHTEALMGSVLDEEFKRGEEKGWPLLKFTEFASLRHGHQFRKYDFTENGIPIVKIGQCKKDGSLDLSNCNFIDQSRLEEFQEDRIYKDDLLMALTGGTLGKVTWVEDDYGDLVQNYRVGNFFSIEGKSIKRFLMYVLMSSIFQKLVEAKVNQGAQPNIGKENIDNMLVPIPSIKKQEGLIKKFDVIMRNQAKMIESQTQKLNDLKALKSSLLDQAFKGEL